MHHDHFLSEFCNWDLLEGAVAACVEALHDEQDESGSSASGRIQS